MMPMAKKLENHRMKIYKNNTKYKHLFLLAEAPWHCWVALLPFHRTHGFNAFGIELHYFREMLDLPGVSTGCVVE